MRVTLGLLMLSLMAGCGQPADGPNVEASAAAEEVGGSRPGTSAENGSSTTGGADETAAGKSTNAAAEWAQFRGPGGLGLGSAAPVPAAWSDSENLIWKTELPGTGTSSPAVYGDRIFLTCYSGYGESQREPGSMDDLRRHALCIHRKTGKLLWQREFKAELPETAYGRRIVAHGYASSTPAVDAERVYCFFGRSGVVALDHEGKQLWQSSVGSGIHGWGSASSPVLYGDLVIVNAFVECGKLVALNKITGEEVWRAGELKESWNTPLLVPLPDGKTELALAISGKVLGFDPATGEELWSCEGHKWYIVGSMVSHDGVVYCISGKGVEATKAIRAGGRGDVTDTHVLWLAKKGSNVSSPVYHDGRLYFAHEQRGIAYCLDAESGALLYETRLPRMGMIYASPVLADGKLFYVSRQGGTAVLAAGPAYNLLSHNRFEGDRSVFNASPAVDDGKLLLRSDRFLYCVGAM